MRKAFMRTFEEPLRHAPRELVVLVGGALALFAVAAMGGLIAAAIPARTHSPWMVMAAWACPAAFAFVVYWWSAQRQ